MVFITAVLNLRLFYVTVLVVIFTVLAVSLVASHLKLHKLQGEQLLLQASQGDYVKEIALLRQQLGIEQETGL